LRGVLGTNIRRVYNSSIFAQTNGGLVVPGLYSLSNSASPINTPTESETSVGVDGVFVSATFGYRERIFLDLTARRDKSTTLPVGNNSYIYPSAALGYVFSEDLRDKAPWLSYGKIRANYAQVGSSALALSVNNVYGKPAIFNSQTLFTVPSTRNNPDLKPEKTRSAEFGLETAFLDSRIGLEITAYQQNTIDQIVPIAQSAASGYLNRYINSGNVRNRGLEIAAFVVPVKTQNFNWRLGANWSRNENTVISLPVDNILLASYQGGVTSNATVGQAYGSLRGSDYVYLNGKREVGSNGYYLTTDANQVIGNPTPRWRGGVTNTLSYKSLSLSFLIDVRSGGSVFSLDRYYGLATGLQPETAGLNDLGNPSRNSIATGGGVIVDGVLSDGTPNTKRVSNSSYGLYGYLRNPASAFVYDASFVKLREVSLTFGLPKAVLAKVSFLKTADFSIIGRNLWIIHKNLPDADPEEIASSGNYGQGYQGGAYPATRTIGANLRFGF
jgi:outer membrane receptor protein involved in Fe transport